MARVPIPEPADNPPCFACSARNPDGMHLQFFREGDAVTTEFASPRTWSGWGDILHGGFQSLLLDEVCSWAYSVLTGSRSFVTSELTVRFKRPVRVRQKLTVRAVLLERDDGGALARGEILDEGGQVLTEGVAKLRELSPERFREISGSEPAEGPFRGAG